ncbi:MAG: hypothetical protein IT436_03235 [Phycisphaerales bacterium]|nr:hypothetical protein [Phycisphaerales bacterium]
MNRWLVKGAWTLGLSLVPGLLSGCGSGQQAAEAQRTEQTEVFELFDDPRYAGIVGRTERGGEEAELAEAREMAGASVITRAGPCPPEGTATTEARRERNRQKNRETAPTPAQTNPAITMTALMKKGSDANRFRVTDGAVIEGYVTDVQVGGVETCNCGAKGPDDRDAHIEVVLRRGDTRRPVVVETTPRWRAIMASRGVDWSTPTLHETLIGHRVRFTGWMFWDLDHVDEADNTARSGAFTWRRTAWEIHPVTGIEVLD